MNSSQRRSRARKFPFISAQRHDYRNAEENARLLQMKAWCNETFGAPEKKWALNYYGYTYYYGFKTEQDLILFVLKWT